MNRYIPDVIKRSVAQRAEYLCEYCLLPNDLSYIPHQIDHVISLKHGGGNETENLAYACFSCNNNKGSDVGTVLLPEKEFVRLYNPRIDKWTDHFQIENGIFISLTAIGAATIKVLDLNNVDKIIERNS